MPEAESDISLTALTTAAHAIDLLDIKYRHALPQDKFQILILIQKAEQELFQARMKNIQDQLSVSSNDISALQEVESGIRDAVNTQDILLSAVKLIATIAAL